MTLISSHPYVSLSLSLYMPVSLYLSLHLSLFLSLSLSLYHLLSLPFSLYLSFYFFVLYFFKREFNAITQWQDKQRKKTKAKYKKDEKYK